MGTLKSKVKRLKTVKGVKGELEGNCSRTSKNGSMNRKSEV